MAHSDDYNRPVVLIDPATNKIVRQFATGVTGAGRASLSSPDGLDPLLPGDEVCPVDFSSSAVHRDRS